MGNKTKREFYIGDRKNRTNGFTAIELLIVIVVVAILTSVVIVAYNSMQVRAKATEVESSVVQYSKGLMAYATSNGSYPVSSGSFCLGEVSDYPNGCDGGIAASASVASALRPVMDSGLPEIDSSCKYMLGTNCRRNLTFLYQADAKLDGKPHPYYLAYFLDGKLTCKVNGGSLGGSEKNYLSTPSLSSYFEQDTDTGVTMCLIAMPDPIDIK